MEALFLTLLNRSISAGWLILAVMVLRLLLKKAPRWIPCVLWGLVGLRLVLPFSPESVLSLIPSAETVPPEILYAAAPEIHSGIAAVNSAVNPALASSMAPAAGASVNPMQVVVYLAARVWILGMAVLLVYSLVSYLRLRRRVARAVCLRDNLWQCETVTTPFVLGLVQPKIYLPFRLDGETLDCVAAHEQAHLKRRDHWTKPLAFLILTVYWFQPLVWVAYLFLCRDLELACDERVVRDWEPARKKVYAEALLSCSQPRPSIAACPLAFGEVGVKQRIKSVLHYRKPAFWILIVAVLVCAVTAVCFLTDPKEAAPEPQIAGTYTGGALLGQHIAVSFLPEDGSFYAEVVVSEDALCIRDREGNTVFEGSEPTVTGTTWAALQAQLEASHIGWTTEKPEFPAEETVTVYAYGGDFLADAYSIIKLRGQTPWLAAGSRLFALAQPPEVFVSSQCLYHNPLSAKVPSDDSGFLYLVEENSFTVVDKASGTELGRFETDGWNWQEFPYSEEAWAALFRTEADVLDLSGYKKRVILPLSDQFQLLHMDGQLWLMEFSFLGQTGPYVWSIYALTPAQTANGVYESGFLN